MVIKDAHIYNINLHKHVKVVYNAMNISPGKKFHYYGVCIIDLLLWPSCVYGLPQRWRENQGGHRWWWLAPFWGHREGGQGWLPLHHWEEERLCIAYNAANGHLEFPYCVFQSSLSRLEVRTLLPFPLKTVSSPKYPSSALSSSLETTGNFSPVS